MTHDSLTDFKELLGKELQGHAQETLLGVLALITTFLEDRRKHLDTLDQQYFEASNTVSMLTTRARLDELANVQLMINMLKKDVKL